MAAFHEDQVPSNEQFDNMNDVEYRDWWDAFMDKTMGEGGSEMDVIQANAEADAHRYGPA